MKSHKHNGRRIKHDVPHAPGGRFVGIDPEALAAAVSDAGSASDPVAAMARRYMADAERLAREDLSYESPTRARAMADAAASLRESVNVPGPSMFSGIDNSTDYSMWLAVTGPGHAADPAQLADQLPRWRSEARFLFTWNEHYRGIIETLVSYIIGRKLKITIRSDDAAIETRARATWAAINRRPDFRFDRRCRELVRRVLRDGESFVREFQSGGVLSFRFIEPEDVVEPTTSNAPDPNQASASFGVETSPRDAESVLAYWVGGERVDASQVRHFKLADMNQKRGVPYLLSVTRRIKRYSSWLEDRIILNKVRTAIALVRHREQATAGHLSTAVNTLKTGTQKVATRSGTTAEYPRQRIVPGMIIDAPPGVRYEFLESKIKSQDVVGDGRQMLLSIAAGACLPEHWVSRDASNANFASTQSAEAPGIVHVQSLQEMLLEECEWMVRRAIAVMGGLESELEAGILTVSATGPKFTVQDKLAVARADQMRHEAGVLSTRTWQERDGLDPDTELQNFDDERQRAEVAATNTPP